MKQVDILTEDMKSISNTKYIPWSNLKNKTIYITGGTGLIGSILIKSLLVANIYHHLNLRILALVRDVQKAKAILGESSQNVIYIQGAVEDLPKIEDDIDFIIHGASSTASHYFVQHPVELIHTAIQGTINILELAKTKNVQSTVYLSSMEVYGAPQTDDTIPETQGCTLDSMHIRNCYPLSKRLCENLCASYVSEYGTHTSVVRLAQTFGPGIAADDQRLFAEIARGVIYQQDIYLQTTGTSKRCYLYTADAITAILLILLTGKSGEAYNVANPNTYSSIVEMATMVIHELSNDTIQLHVPSVNTAESYKYPPNHYLNLDVTKLMQLGWSPTRELKDMFVRMISTMERN